MKPGDRVARLAVQEYGMKLPPKLAAYLGAKAAKRGQANLAGRLRRGRGGHAEACPLLAAMRHLLDQVHASVRDSEPR